LLYVDALAVDAQWRWRGVARALLAEADRMAEHQGLRGVALDTGIENGAARALYQRSGFEQRGLRPAPDERSARAIGGSGFVGYVKRRS
jgi:ribosomal protein S18 acetylase RimI-like enzyme